MKWRSASSARQFRLVDQTLTLDQVAEFCRTRRVKEGIGSLASISAAFGPAGSIHLGNPGQYERAAMARRAYEIGQSGVCIGRSKFRPRGGEKTGHRGGHWPRLCATKIPYE